MTSSEFDCLFACLFMFSNSIWWNDDDDDYDDNDDDDDDDDDEMEWKRGKDDEMKNKLILYWHIQLKYIKLSSSSSSYSRMSSAN